jgi:UDP-glucuronate decarboxylase
MNPPILITGGTGFFGKALLRCWPESDLGHIRPTILTRDPQRFAHQRPELAQRADWVRGDVMEPASLPRHVPFSSILHAAADSTHGDRLSPLERFDQIVTGTRNILDFAVASGIQRVLITSSGGVYGRQPFQLEGLPEDHMGMPDPLSSANAYGVAKRAAEHLGALYAQRHGLQVIVARCFAFVGPDLPLDVHFAIGNFIRDALWSDEIIVQGDGTAIRSYMDQRDLAQWLTTLLVRGQPGHAYNVGSDRAITIGALAHLVRDIVSPTKPVRILGKALGNAERNRYVPDIRKAQRDLGLACAIPLEQSIRDTADAARHRQQPAT